MNKKILVTGVSSGIGDAIARDLIKDGYFIIGTYNSTNPSKIKKDLGDKIELHKIDLSDRKQTNQLISKLNNIELHGIVNNAGMIDFEDFEDFDFDIWDKTFEVNVNAPLLISNKLSKNLSKNNAIINIASTDGFTGTFSSMSYSASKAALINLTKSLGNNLGLKGIRAIAIAPGWIDTGMSTEESYEAASLTPLNRNGLPEEVAKLVSYLLSENASFINGSCIKIDGGYTNVDYIMMKEAKLDGNVGK